MNEKQFIPFARLLSIIFTPFYLPLVGMVALFVFSYLSMLSWGMKLQVLLATYLFTILIPTLLIHAYRKYQGWALFEFIEREKRMVPYAISITSYLTCYFLMRIHHVPHFMTAIVMAALIVQVVCALTNMWYKLSVHCAAIGGVTGGVVAFSLIFGFNAVWWLVLLLFISGLVGTARMMLRMHSLIEVCVGYIVGLITTFIVVVLI